MKRQSMAAAAALLAMTVLAASPALRAEERGHHDGKEWKQKFGLTDDQVKKLEDLDASEKGETKPLRDKHHALVEKLEGQIKAKASDSELKTTLADIADNHKAMEASENKFKASRDAIFTTTQQAKMMIHRMKEHEEKERKEKGEKEDDDKDK